MAAAGEAYDTNTTLGQLRTSLITKGFISYTAPGYGNFTVFMHPLRLRGITLLGNDSDLALVYQKRLVDNALRRV